MLSLSAGSQARRTAGAIKKKKSRMKPFSVLNRIPIGTTVKDDESREVSDRSTGIRARGRDRPTIKSGTISKNEHSSLFYHGGLNRRHALLGAMLSRGPSNFRCDNGLWFSRWQGVGASLRRARRNSRRLVWAAPDAD
jgi:hypothetical protein